MLLLRERQWGHHDPRRSHMALPPTRNRQSATIQTHGQWHWCAFFPTYGPRRHRAKTEKFLNSFYSAVDIDFYVQFVYGGCDVARVGGEDSGEADHREDVR